MIAEGMLVLDETGTYWGIVKNTYTDFYGTERAYVAHAFKQQNFQVLVETEPLREIAEGSYEHRLMILAEALTLIPTMGRPGQFTWLRETIEHLGAKPKARELTAAASAVKTIISRMRGTLKVAEIRVILAEFIAAENA